VCWRAGITARRSPLAHLYRALLSPNPMHIAYSTAGSPKVSPGVAECPTVHYMAFQDCFHSYLLFRSGNCKLKWFDCWFSDSKSSNVMISYHFHFCLMNWWSNYKYDWFCAIDLLILSSPLLSIYWFCCASFSLTQSICLINASIHCSLSGNWYAEAQTKQNKKEEKDLNSVWI
jgi:hypothetical protein